MRDGSWRRYGLLQAGEESRGQHLATQGAGGATPGLARLLAAWVDELGAADQGTPQATASWVTVASTAARHGRKDGCTTRIAEVPFAPAP